MTTSYDLDIVANESFVLKINFSGIKEGETSVDTLVMSIYAYRSDTGSPIFSHSLWVDEIRRLYGHLSGISLIKDCEVEKSWKFIEASEGVVELIKDLESIEPGIIRTVFDKFQEEERILRILSVLTEIEAENLHAAHKYQQYRKELDNLKELLRLEKVWNIVSDIVSVEALSPYAAGQPEKIFQNWIERNLWIFWVDYLEKYDFRRVAFFSDADLLMKSMDGFLDLIELKRPKYDLFKFDDSHNCHYPSGDLSKVIGQCLFYLQQMDVFKLTIESQHPETQILAPRIKIIAGRTADFSPDQYKALRILNSNLNHIQIMSYDYLVQCWEQLLLQYTPNP